MFVALLGAAGGPAASATAATIAIDAGHSLQKPGAISAHGVSEFEFNRDLAVAVTEQLRKDGFEVVTISAGGHSNDLASRAAQAGGAALLLSLHHDSVQPRYLEDWTVDGSVRSKSTRFSGFSLFVSRKNPKFRQSLACASRIGSELRKAGFQRSLHHAEPIPGENRPIADSENGVHYFDDLIVLKKATVPAVLIEAGIIVNPEDEKSLRRADTRERMAAAISAASSCLIEAPATSRAK